MGKAEYNIYKYAQSKMKTNVQACLSLQHHYHLQNLEDENEQKKVTPQRMNVVQSATMEK